MTTAQTELGLKAEGAVADHLERLGFTVLDRNWRRPWGELDIVASRGSIIHFVEVKASGRNLEGFEPAVRADWRKMTKVQRTARSWLAAKQYDAETEWQMDVASVIMGSQIPEIDIIENI